MWIVFILFLVCDFICHKSDPFYSILSFGQHRPSDAQVSSPACLVPDLACSDFQALRFSVRTAWISAQVRFSFVTVFPVLTSATGFGPRWVLRSFGFLVSLRPRFRVFHFSTAIFFFCLEAFCWVDFYSWIGCAVTKLLIWFLQHSGWAEVLCLWWELMGIHVVLPTVKNLRFSHEH
jgi:hypothetical protein